MGTGGKPRLAGLEKTAEFPNGEKTMKNNRVRDPEHAEQVRQFFEDAEAFYAKDKERRKRPIAPAPIRRPAVRRRIHIVATNKTTEIVTNANMG